MLKTAVMCGAGILFIFNSLFFCFAQDQITITTYFPSPSGSYDQLQARRLGVGDTDKNGVLNNADIPVTNGDVWISGRVGIGTRTPRAGLDVNGGVRIGNDVAICSGVNAGTVRYNGGVMEFCDGGGWRGISTPTFQIVVAPTTGWSGTPPDITATCPAGYTVLGGTCDWDDWDSAWGDARSSQDGNGWRCKSWDASRAARAFAFCVR